MPIIKLVRTEEIAVTIIAKPITWYTARRCVLTLAARMRRSRRESEKEGEKERERERERKVSQTFVDFSIHTSDGRPFELWPPLEPAIAASDYVNCYMYKTNLSARLRLNGRFVDRQYGYPVILITISKCSPPLEEFERQYFQRFREAPRVY